MSMSFFLLYFCLITTHYGSLFRSENFFRTTQELEYLFFCRAKHGIFFQNLTFGYMTKTLNHIFFFLHQNQNIFFSNIGNQNIFLEKTITPSPPPFQVKWSFPNMNILHLHIKFTINVV
jgi:hypothetical protein